MNEQTINNGDQCYKLAIANENPLSYIVSFTPAIYWLSELYSELLKESQIEPLQSLPLGTKLHYWNFVQKIPKEKKWLRISAARAVYVFSILSKQIE